MEQSIKPINIESEMRSSFLDYSMSVIVSRALPDVRDGLKPVHRRIMYAMYNLKNFHNRPFLKSARIVGEVIGRYHPHGDSAVYEALVRMAQEFSMRYPLVDGQGNFGSIDGDPAAAMRYTESRLHELAGMLLTDIEKETVDFAPNYDNKEVEPTVLPTKLPQLLVNGSSGIAVGMATNMPPHNLSEVVDALNALIENPEISVRELMEYIKGPDFPTAGQIYGISGIVDAYTKGRGSVVVRARAEIEPMPKSAGRERIIITEIPYQVNKWKLIEKIADLVRSKRLEGISEIRDESAKEEIRVVIELKKGEIGQVVLNNLYKLTPLQSSFGVNSVALVNGTPQILPLKTILSEFYDHRRKVVLRRTAFELRKAEDRAHILEGLKIAVDNLDAVVELIRASKDSSEAHYKLVANFSLSDLQAKAILDMRLARLTGLELQKIIEEYNEVMALIKDLRDILDTPQRVTDIILEDLKELKEKFGDVRKTEIIASEADALSMEQLVADEEVAVVVTHSGYVKRTALAQINAQKRGGKGKSGIITKDEDVVKDLFISSNHQSLLCFSNRGKVYQLKVYEIPEAPLRARGKHFANLVKLEDNESIVSVLSVKEFKEDHFVVSVSKRGLVKKTDLMAYSNVRSTGIIGLKLDEDDDLVNCCITSGQDDVLIATRLGKAIRFVESEIRPTGRASRGVTGIRFSEDADFVIGMEIVMGESAILSVCENGFGKRTPLKEYRRQTRGGKGIYTIKVTERNGPVIGICQVNEEDHLMVMTSKNKLMRFTVKEVGVVGRLTQGVKLMNVEKDESVIAVSKAPEVQSEEDEVE